MILTNLLNGRLATRIRSFFLHNKANIAEEMRLWFDFVFAVGFGLAMFLAIYTMDDHDRRPLENACGAAGGVLVDREARGTAVCVHPIAVAIPAVKQ